MENWGRVQEPSGECYSFYIFIFFKWTTDQISAISPPPSLAFFFIPQSTKSRKQTRARERETCREILKGQNWEGSKAKITWIWQGKRRVQQLKVWQNKNFMQYKEESQFEHLANQKLFFSTGRLRFDWGKLPFAGLLENWEILSIQCISEDRNSLKTFLQLQFF